MPETNGVESAPRPLHVVIVGAGIGGCTAALALRQQGHNVTLLERSELARELGAAIHLAPNANGLLKRLGIDTDNEVGACEAEWFSHYLSNGELKMPPIHVGEINRARWEHAWLLAHRVDLHNTLKYKATESSGHSKGPPAHLRTQSEVVRVDCEYATVQLKNGESIAGDVIIGADGVNSIVRESVAGRPVKPVPSGRSAFRWLIPRKTLEDDPATANYAERKGNMTLMIDGPKTLVMYPCRDNTEFNFLAIHPDTQNLTEGWGQRGDKEKLLQIFDGFGAEVKALLSKVDPLSLKIWKLMDMEVLQSWIRGSTTLLGDAAHPFLPYLGQGGGCAIEDAVSLAVVLPKGTRVQEIPARLKLYQDCRMERANNLQEYTREACRSRERGGPPINPIHTAYGYGHDEFFHSSKMYREWIEAQTPTRPKIMPLAITAHSMRELPSSCPDLRGQEFISATIAFRSSRTYLENLFPSSSFTFKLPDTIAHVRLTFTSYTIAGQQKNRLHLSLNGVKYTAKTGEIHTGDYLALVLSDDHETLISDRELYGIPTVLCKFETQIATDHIVVKAIYHDQAIITFSVHDLNETEDPQPDNGNPVLTYKYIPSLSPPTPDVAYKIRFPDNAHTQGFASAKSTAERRYGTRNATLRFEDSVMESSTSPGLLSGLSEILNFGVDYVEVVKGEWELLKRKAMVVV